MTELSSTKVLSASPEVVEGVLRDVTKWPVWVPGLAECGQPSRGEVRGVWSGPVNVGFHFSLAEANGTLTCEMVESDVPFIELRIAWDACEEGTSVAVTLVLQMGRTLPGTLWRELEHKGLPALLTGLEDRTASAEREG